MTRQDQNAALLNQLGKHGEEMFHGATIQELTSLVDEVTRTHETNVIYSRSGDLNGILVPGLSAYIDLPLTLVRIAL